ncbi:MAG: hypothetical protein H0V67_12285 [Geodermatophilaceae bacterium]|nr:hypothetical protein [Geodermatophilaceae bacterium]
MQVVQEQSAQTQLPHMSEQEAHEQVAWLHRGQVQSAHAHAAQESLHCAHSQTLHSS